MGSYLSQPVTKKHNQSGSGNGLSYSISSMQGWREDMEDNHCAYIGLPQSMKEWNFFAVFDGHSGNKVSSYSSENLLDTILKSEDFSEILNNSHMFNENIKIIKNSIRKGYLELDSKMKSVPEIVKDDSGSTAVSVLISEKHVYFANCGDSRVVFSRNKEVHFATTDHKPVNDTEKMRIERSRGTVRNNRVNGILAVSRCLGDYSFKQNAVLGPCEQQISPEPDITVLERNYELDEFVVLACDGVWDVMTNKEICDNIRYLMQITTNLEDICNCVLDACLEKGSKDNMSIILIVFPGSPQVSHEFIKEDKNINAKIEERVKDVLLKNDLSKVLLDIITPKEEEIFDSLPLLPSPVFDFKSELLEQICAKLTNILLQKDNNIMEIKEFYDLRKNVLYNNDGCENEIRYGVRVLTRDQEGRREKKEVTRTTIANTSIGLKNWSFFALFDNHITTDYNNFGIRDWPSSNCIYGAENLLNAIIENFNFEKYGNLGKNENIVKVMKNIRNGFLSLDKKIKIVNEEKLKSSYFRTDTSVGTTVVSVLISPTHFYFANCGNLRAFLVRNGKVCFVTKHYGFLEKLRLVKINEDYMHDVKLNCSRALGVHNFYYKDECGRLKSVSSDPKIEVIERDQLDEFLVLLCHKDEISCFKNETIELEICNRIRYMMKISSDLEYICSYVSKICFQKGYKNNMSMIVVVFPGAPKFSLEAKEREEYINQVIECRVKNILAASNEKIACRLLEELKVGREFMCNSLGLPSNTAYFKHKLFMQICKEIAKKFTSELKNQDPKMKILEKLLQTSPQDDGASKKSKVAPDDIKNNELDVTVIDFDNYSEEVIIVKDSKKAKETGEQKSLGHPQTDVTKQKKLWTDSSANSSKHVSSNTSSSRLASNNRNGFQHISNNLTNSMPMQTNFYNQRNFAITGTPNQVNSFINISSSFVPNFVMPTLRHSMTDQTSSLVPNAFMPSLRHSMTHQMFSHVPNVFMPHLTHSMTGQMYRMNYNMPSPSTEMHTFDKKSKPANNLQNEQPPKKKHKLIKRSPAEWAELARQWVEKQEILHSTSTSSQHSSFPKTNPENSS